MSTMNQNRIFIYSFCSVLLLSIMFQGCSSDEKKNDSPGEGGETPNAETYKPLLSYDMSDGVAGATFLNWKKSVYDAAYSVTNGKSVKVTTSPGEMLPTCSGNQFYAGRTIFDKEKQVPPGKTLWYRVMIYVPSTFSFGHKYSGSGDTDEAKACGQHSDGNTWIKWLVLSPTKGTGRVYLMPSGQRRLVEDRNRVRIISEELHLPHDVSVSFPKDKWFALQIAVKVSNGSDGFIRAWIDDNYLGEVVGKTFSAESSVYDWGIGDYWNGVPWSDNQSGRTDFWIDEIIMATDMEGYGAPTTLDSGDRPYISPDARVVDFK